MIRTKQHGQKNLTDYVCPPYLAHRWELWAMDEHRVGLHPILRAVWTPPGQRSVVAVHPRYEWLYVYGFVRPSTGENFWLLLPMVSTVAMSIALAQFEAYLTAQRRVFLVIDRASYHTSDRLSIPPTIRRFYLPSYSPELQPAEHLWALTDDPLINQTFASLNDLEAVLIDRCCWLQDHPEVVRSTTLFHWWPDYA